MKRFIILCAASAAIIASETSAGGLNIAWNTCAGAGADSLRAFACATDPNPSGTVQTLVCSFVSDFDIPAFAGTECFVDLTFPGTAVPSMWDRACTGRTPISIGLESPCTNDIYQGIGAGGLAAYNLGMYWANEDFHSGQPNQAYVDFVGAVPAGSETQVVAGVEYFLGTISFKNVRSCEGCETPMLAHFQELWVEGAYPAPRYILTQGIRPNAHWQSVTLPGGVPSANRATTWGAIKATYR